MTSSRMSERGSVEQRAREWIEQWNARDLEAVLAQYAEEVAFRSPRAVAVTGSAVVRGKPALRAYWSAALEEVASLRFELDEVLWDGESRAMSILYTSEADGARRSVCETMWLDGEDRVIRAEVFHGALHE